MQNCIEIRFGGGDTDSGLCGRKSIKNKWSNKRIKLKQGTWFILVTSNVTSHKATIRGKLQVLTI